MKKLIIILTLVLAAGAAFLYRPSIPLEKLKSKYTNEQSAFVSIDGMNAHYRQSGSGFPVLLVHGTSSSLHTWHYWQDALSERFTVYSVDLPGCGLTGPHPEDDYTIGAYLDFLEKFTSAIGLDSFYVAGNSLGGHIAWEYAASSPKVLKAVLVDPSGFHAEDRKIPLVFTLGRKKIFAAVVEKLNVDPLIGKSLREVYFDDDLVTPELKQRYSDLIRRKGNRLAFVKKVAGVELGAEADLWKIDVPVLIQWGREDLWIPIELADIFVNNIPDNELIVYENCGHVPQEELPERSAADAMEFLLTETNVPDADTTQTL